MLAKIFWILTKMIRDKDSDNDAVRNFDVKFGEKAIHETLDILIRNQQRQVEDADEQQEKLELSLSCIMFLKACSLKPNLRLYLSERHEDLKAALYAEQEFTGRGFVKTPIEIETTWLGRNIGVLLHSVQRSESVNAYNFVSFRVLQRMGDILMNQIEIEDKVGIKPGVDVILTLINEA